MPYKTSGTLTTDEREVAIDETWDTDSDWNAYQSKTDIEINNGVVELLFTDQPSSGVSRWEFEQDVTDSWGDNDGTDNTSAGYSTDAQLGSYSKAFDGADDSVGHPTVSIGDDFTLTGWFNSDDVSIVGTIHGLFDGYWHIIRTNSGDLSFAVRDGGDGNTVTITTAISSGTWYFYAATYASNGDMELYLNDANSQGTNNYSYTDSGTANQFGYDSNSNGRYYDGLIDDPRIYDKVLSSTEVSDLYNTGSI